MKYKMTDEQWIKFATSLKYGDECHVFPDKWIDHVVEFGDSDDKSPDPFKFEKYLHPIHTFRYFGLGRGATIEADPSGSKWHVIDEYRDRVKAGDVRIIVTRHPDLTVDDFSNFKAEGDRQINKPYGFGAIAGYALYRIVRDTFIGSLWRSLKWQTPWCDRNSPVCSQGVRLQKDNVKKYYDVMKKLSVWQDNTPQRFFDETTTLTVRVMDTYRISKDNMFDYPEIKI